MQAQENKLKWFERANYGSHSSFSMLMHVRWQENCGYPCGIRFRFCFGFALVRLCRLINKLKHLLYISCITLCVYIERNSYVDKSIRIFLGSKWSVCCCSAIQFLAIAYTFRSYWTGCLLIYMKRAHRFDRVIVNRAPLFQIGPPSRRNRIEARCNSR